MPKNNTTTTAPEGKQDFKIGDKVKDLSNIQGTVLDVNPGLIRVAFGEDGKSNWRDLSPKYLTITHLQDKGNGHTPGELKVQYSELMNQVWLQSSKGNMAFINGNDNDNIFTTVEAKANAARIVECWNEHDQLKADKNLLLAQLSTEDMYSSLLRDENDGFKKGNELLKAAFDKLSKAAAELKTENEKLKEDNMELVEVLNKIKNWQLPATGQFWDKEEKEPLSYGAAYGSNGERDYFKNIASEAIAKHNQ